VSRLKTASQRQEYLDALKASGETVSKWCKRNGMHRTTVYRWLRQEAKNKAETAKTPLAKPVEQTDGSAQIKWLSVSKKRGSERTESKESVEYQTTCKPDALSNVEIRVQIGRFTVTTPDGFKRETLESVCQALQTIC